MTEGGKEGSLVHTVLQTDIMIDCDIDSPHLGLPKKLLSGPGLCGGQVQEEGVAHLVQVRLDTTLIQVTYLVRGKVGRMNIQDLKIVCVLNFMRAPVW